MKKFCFVLLDSINRTPYIKKYINACEFHYDIILWDRMHNSDACGADNCYYFKTEKLSSGLKEKAQKARAYLQFSRYIRNVLTKNEMIIGKDLTLDVLSRDKVSKVYKL